VVSGAFIELVACFLRRGGRICLLLRSPEMASAPNMWHVVSGYLPTGVEPLAHALREVEEETGLAAGQLRLARRAEPVVLQREGDVRRWLVHPFLFDVLAGEPRLNWEHVELNWVAPDEVRRFHTMRWIPWLLDKLLGPAPG
jgi:8-oxo-dGTP pyrophosphatase MutT (NUDIX family)